MFRGYEIDWPVAIFVGVVLLLTALVAWVFWRIWRPRKKAPRRPERTLYGTVIWPKGQNLRAPAGAPPRSGPAPQLPAPQARPGPPRLPVAQGPQASSPPPMPMPRPQASPAPPLPVARPQAAARPMRMRAVPGGAPGGSETFVGMRSDKTVWMRGKVKIVMPKKERTLLKLLPIPILLGIAGAAWLAYHYISERIATSSAREKHVEARFRVEKLVPPSPLPPLFFRNAERPELETANRDWTLLDADFQQALLRVLARLSKEGRTFVLIEGYRSPETQERLKAMGPHVTRAGAYQSQHQRGLAADVAPVKNGVLSISEKDPWTMEAYQMLGRAAVAEGLVWGGAWSSLRDYGHVEAPRNSK